MRSVALYSTSSHRFFIFMSAPLIAKLARSELISSIVPQSLDSDIAKTSLTI